jgi:hypothetical protein
MNGILRKLMLSLIYPAVHGAGLLWLVSGWASTSPITDVFFDPRSYLALWLVLFFAVSFIMTELLPENSYGGRAFLCDLAEAAILFVCFVNLGYVVPESTGRADIRLVFLLLAIIPLIEWIWNVVTGRRKANLLFLCGAVVAGTLAVVVFGDRQWVVRTGIAGLYLALGGYLLLRISEAKKQG